MTHNANTYNTDYYIIVTVKYTGLSLGLCGLFYCGNVLLPIRLISLFYRVQLFKFIASRNVTLALATCKISKYRPFKIYIFAWDPRSLYKYI